MSNTRYLIDNKNRRSFELGDRYYGQLFTGSINVASVEDIFYDLKEHGNYGTEDNAIKIWAFCEVAGWDLSVRDENTSYGEGRMSANDPWGDDGYTRVDSVWDLPGDREGIVSDPCATEQAAKEEEARKRLLSRSSIGSGR